MSSLSDSGTGSTAQIYGNDYVSKRNLNMIFGSKYCSLDTLKVEKKYTTKNIVRYKNYTTRAHITILKVPIYRYTGVQSGSATTQHRLTQS